MDEDTERIIRSLVSKYTRQLKSTREELILDPSGLVDRIKEDLKVKHQIEAHNLTLKILRILTENEFNL